MTGRALIVGSISAVLLLTACGGDSHRRKHNAVAFGAEGTWLGSLATPANDRLIQAAVLGDGTFWMVYSGAGGSGVGGIVQGSGSAAKGVFTVTDATLLSVEDNLKTTASIAANYVARSSLGGSLSQGVPVTPSLPATVGFASLYQLSYDQNLTLDDLIGSYSGTITTKLGSETATVDIDNDGVIAGSNESGCSLNGQALAQPRGNVFTLDLRFGSEDACSANKDVEVIGIVSLEVDKVTALAMDADKNNSFIFTGTR